jgi:hypothetical protein
MKSLDIFETEIEAVKAMVHNALADRRGSDHEWRCHRTRHGLAVTPPGVDTGEDWQQLYSLPCCGAGREPPAKAVESIAYALFERNNPTP